MTSTAHWTELAVGTPLATLCVRHAGAGAPIVFLHNLFLGSEMREDVGDSLSDQHHVILIEGPGHGGSEPLAKPFVMADTGRAVLGVLHALAVDKAVFAGSSWGSVGALEIALDQPDRVAALVVMNATASGFTRDQKIYFKGVADQIRAEGFSDEILAGQQDCALRFEELDLPILLLCGSEDHALPVDPYMEEVKSGLPGATSEIVPGAGQAASWETPKPVADEIRHLCATSG